jgi:hypothetical protein
MENRDPTSYCSAAHGGREADMKCCSVGLGKIEAESK